MRQRAAVRPTRRAQEEHGVELCVPGKSRVHQPGQIARSVVLRATRAVHQRSVLLPLGPLFCLRANFGAPSHTKSVFVATAELAGTARPDAAAAAGRFVPALPKRLDLVRRSAADSAPAAHAPPPRAASARHRRAIDA